MKGPAFIGVIWAGLFAVEAAAHELLHEIDVVAWLDGCAALTQPNGGISMDSECVVVALKYCPFGRPGHHREECYGFLAQAFEDRSVALAESLSSASTKDLRLQRKLDELKRDPTSFDRSVACPEEFSVEQCTSLKAGFNWMNIRSLQRRHKQRVEWQ